MHAPNPDKPNGLEPARIDVGDQHVRVGEPTMKAIFDRVQRLAEDRLPVLITGESGVGKEVVARALHHSSPWASGPFVAVNCGGLPPTLIETELFGHEKGAFSGAVGAKQGLIESAAGGTLLLDEVGELPLEMQTRLLRVLDRRESRRVGAVRSRQLDVRIVAATNRDLVTEVTAGRFRSDLLFRLKGSTIVVPPLRERPLDIPVLARDLLEAACARRRREPLIITAGALFAMLRYAWPGNVRELKHAMEWAVLAASHSSTVEVEHLPEELRQPSAALPVMKVSAVAAGLGPRPVFAPIAEELRELERLRMVQALDAAGWVVMDAARLIRMARRTFVKKVKRYDIRRPGR